MPLKTPAAAALLLIPLLLVGCASGPAEDEREDDDTSSSEESTEETTEEEEEEGPEALAFGDTFLVEDYEATDGVQSIEVSVTGVREGSVDDFSAAGLDQDFLDQIADFDIYYIDIAATKGEPNEVEMAYESIYSDFSAINADGDRATPISIIGTFEPCDTNSIDPEFDTGAEHTTCVIVGLAAGDEFGGAIFAPYDSAYDYYDGEPIVWRD